MNKTHIHLSQPFEEILATVLSLPRGPGERSERISHGADLKRVVRRLYEAANGRQVETILGPIPIAPAVAPFLKEESFEVETQLDFLLEAASRVLAAPSRVLETNETGGLIGNANGKFRAVQSARAFDHPHPATLATSL